MEYIPNRNITVKNILRGNAMIELFIKELKEKGYKQEEIQKLTGLSQGYISRLSRGAKPSLETVIKLADVFGVTTDEVLGRRKNK